MVLYVNFGQKTTDFVSLGEKSLLRAVCFCGIARHSHLYIAGASEQLLQSLCTG